MNREPKIHAGGVGGPLRDGIMACVEAGLGITLLPPLVVERLRSTHRVRAYRIPPAILLVEAFFV